MSDSRGWALEPLIGKRGLRAAHQTYAVSPAARTDGDERTNQASVLNAGNSAHIASKTSIPDTVAPYRLIS